MNIPGVELGLLAWLLFGIVCALVARKKGRSGCAWFALGVLLGPFGLLLAFAASPQREGTAPAPPPQPASPPRTEPPVSPADLWTCPRCGSGNAIKSNRCGNCGYSLEE